MRYPIGLQSFDHLREEGYVYVDKTAMVYSLAHGSTVYFLGRPRRFGKSLLISTFENYFLGKKELFKGLAIEKLETEWKTYPVFHIDFGTGSYANADALNQIFEFYISGWEKKYRIEREPGVTDYNLRFKKILEEAHQQTGLRAVVLVDEYDKPLLDVMDTGYMVEHLGEQITLEEKNRNMLRAFYSTFKGADKHLQFVFLTGVTKFSQVSVFSDFNQPNDISMSPMYDTICGITDEELEQTFSQQIEELAAVYGYTEEKMRGVLKKRFDGYHFSKRMKGVYNPFSILNTFDKQDVQDYWFRTGTPTYLVRLLNHFDENLDELTGKYYMTDQFVDYRADKEKPLPMIFQSGYLTIKGYDPDFRIYNLAYPNGEVRQGFVESLLPAYVHLPGENSTFYVVSFIRDLRKGDIESCLERTRSFFASIPNDLENKTEKHYQTIFYLLFRLMGQYVDAEVKSAVGRADVVVRMKDAIYVFEFKFDGTPEEALAQIDSKQYAIPYQAEGRKVVKVGVNFDSATRTIGGWVVE